MGGPAFDGRECSTHPHGDAPWEGAIAPGDYRDAEGFMFTDVEFS